MYNYRNLYPVIPLFNNSKTPYIKWSIEDNWITDKETLQTITKRNSYTHIDKEGAIKVSENITGFALLTGTKSNIVVIDLDRNHSDGVDGVNNFMQYLEHNNITQDVLNTFTVKTPSGGLHLYYRSSEVLSNTASNLIQGVDTRANGGIIVLDGSETDKGVYTVIKDTDILPLPTELKILFNTKESTVRNKMDLLDYLDIQQGSRNNDILKVANRLRRNFSSYEDFVHTMFAINCTYCNPPLSQEELESIINNVWNYQADKEIHLPLGYSYSENRIYYSNPDSKDEEGEDIAPTLIYPGYLSFKGRRVNIDTNETQYIIQGRDGNDISPLIYVNGQDLFGSRKEQYLQDLFASQKGFVNLVNIKPKVVLTYLDKQLDYVVKNNLVQDELYSNNVGWVNYNKGKYLVYPSEDVVIDTIQTNNLKVIKSFNTSGTVEEWVDNVLTNVTNSDNGCMMMLAGFSSPLISMLELNENFIVQLEGRTSTGKSACEHGVCSIYGKPSSYIQNWNTTKNAADTMFSLNGSYPVIYDDLKTVDNSLRRKLPNLVYGFVSGTGRSRANKDGSLQEQKYHNNVLITSGEYPITDDLKGHEGATARILVLRGSFLPPNPINKGIVDTIYLNSNKYYGTVGLEWSKFLVSKKDNVAELKDLYLKYKNELSNQTENNIINRKINALALLKITGYLLNEFLGKDYFSYETLIDEMLIKVEQVTNESDINKEAFITVVEHYKDKVNSDQDIIDGGVVGFYRENYNGQKVLFVKSAAVSKVLKDMDYNSSLSLNNFRDSGWILTDKKKWTTILVRGKGRYVGLIVDEYYNVISREEEVELTYKPKETKTNEDVF